eukprot:CAMPEP_0119311844 /NCGR_PEP_ID=MMETSP1333-20130426/24141_1 /TAXON_ID=418940 /ORGANISM="Scyphosphaera apsteinii, Strain RCC1455" /LENGTH=1075 /DNA_ID=CAMNT_0007316329 /DNA_START=161 /DNA_END=3388 /DNA_ORIENTATION=-
MAEKVQTTCSNSSEFHGIEHAHEADPMTTQACHVKVRTKDAYQNDGSAQIFSREFQTQHAFPTTWEGTPADALNGDEPPASRSSRNGSHAVTDSHAQGHMDLLPDSLAGLTLSTPDWLAGLCASAGDANQKHAAHQSSLGNMTTAQSGAVHTAWDDFASSDNLSQHPCYTSIEPPAASPAGCARGAPACASLAAAGALCSRIQRPTDCARAPDAAPVAQRNQQLPIGEEQDEGLSAANDMLCAQAIPFHPQSSSSVRVSASQSSSASSMCSSHLAMQGAAQLNAHGPNSGCPSNCNEQAMWVPPPLLPPNSQHGYLDPFDTSNKPKDQFSIPDFLHQSPMATFGHEAVDSSGSIQSDSAMQRSFGRHDRQTFGDGTGIGQASQFARHQSTCPPNGRRSSYNTACSGQPLSSFGLTSWQQPRSQGSTTGTQRSEQGSTRHPRCGDSTGNPLQPPPYMMEPVNANNGPHPLAGEHNLDQMQMMQLQHMVMKLTLVAPNKQELRKMLQTMLSQERVAEAHIMVGMMRMVGLPVDVVMYNLLMTAYKKRRQWQLVLQVMQQMQASGVTPDIVSYNILIDACGKAQQLYRAFEYYDEMVRLGLQPGVNTYTSLIDACGKTQQLKRAYELLSQMQQEGVQPNAHTFTTIINACTQAQDLDLGLQVLEQMITCGAAHEVGQSTVTPYTTLIRACGKAFAVDKAFVVLRCMLDVGLKPNTVTFNCLIDACSKAHDLDKAFQVLRLMYHYNNPPDQITYTALIDACLKAQAIGRAFELISQMQKEDLQPSSSMYSSLLDACVKAQQIDLIFEALHMMGGAGVRPSNSSFTAIIQACGKATSVERAFDVMAYMKYVNVRPNATTYTALINVSAEAKDLQRAIAALQEMVMAGEVPEITVFNALIELCGTVGQLAYASKIMEYMRKVQAMPNSSTFKTLAVVCIQCGDIVRAERTLQEMTYAGFEPDNSMLEPLLNTCIARGESAQTVLQLLGHFPSRAEGAQASFVLISVIEKATIQGQYAMATQLLQHILGQTNTALSKDTLLPVLQSMHKQLANSSGDMSDAGMRLLQMLQDMLLSQDTMDNW